MKWLDHNHTGNFSREAAGPLTPGLGLDGTHCIQNHKTELYTRKFRQRQGGRINFLKTETPEAGSVIRPISWKISCLLILQSMFQLLYGQYFHLIVLFNICPVHKFSHSNLALHWDGKFICIPLNVHFLGCDNNNLQCK